MNSRTNVNWTPLPGPLAVESPDRIPKQRYYDPDFYALEAELFWPRVWQMACRLEEIPEPGDFVEYEILDQSIIFLRTEDMGARALHNACPHRGVTGPTGGTRSLPARRPSPSTICGRRTSISRRCAARHGAAAPSSTSVTMP